MSSDTDESGQGLGSGVKQKKMKYSQKYNKCWENDEFKWCKSSAKGSTYAYCVVCCTDLTLKAGKGDLRKHANTKKHLEKCALIKSQPSVLNIPSTSRKSREEETVKSSEIRFAAFISEHDLPFTIAEHLPHFIQAVCPDSAVAKKLKCGRTKATAIVKNVTGRESFTQLIETLKQQKFSLIVDESTDKGCIKHLCLLARTVMEDDVKDCFLALIPVQDGSATTLHKNIVSFFEENNIPYKENMIGFGADGANAMFGPHHSLSTLLIKDIPNLFTMKCICHSYALCASYACLKLPRGIEDLARNVYAYFSNSPKRVESLKEFQAFANVKPNKMLHPSQTRWLSLQMVVSRLLEQYGALTLYFRDAVTSEKLLSCDQILATLDDQTTKPFLHFLDFILPVFNILNQQMQSETSQIHTLYKSVTRSYRTILDCYLRDEYLQKTPLEHISPQDPHNFRDIDSMYFGAKVEMSLCQGHTMHPQAVKNFKLKCLDFYIEAALQISRRFPFRNKVFKNLEALDPSVVKARSVATISPLMSSFPSLVNDDTLQKIDNEWRMLRNSLTTLLSDDTEETPVKFWMKVKGITSGDGTPVFPFLAEFMIRLLCLPHSSAAAERVFSAVNRMKTKTRNRLSTSTMAGLLHTRRLMTDRKCYDVKISDSLIKRMTSNIYESPSSDEEN